MRKTAWLYHMYVPFLCLGVVLLSCESVDLFKSQEDVKAPLYTFQSETAPFLIVTKTGTSYRLAEKLVVYPNGYAVVYQHKSYIEKRTLFSSLRVQQIRDLLIHSNILNIANNTSRQTHNTITYEVEFSNGSITHFTIVTDEDLPQNVKDLIIGIEKIIENIIYDGLQIELMVPSSETFFQDSLRVSLIVTNTGDRSMELVFPTTQEFDFYISADLYSEDSVYDWHWANDKIFAQAVQSKTIPAKTSIVYQTAIPRRRDINRATWRSAYLIGMCLSTPGGTPREIAIPF